MNPVTKMEKLGRKYVTHNVTRIRGQQPIFVYDWASTVSVGCLQLALVTCTEKILHYLVCLTGNCKVIFIDLQRCKILGTNGMAVMMM